MQKEMEDAQKARHAPLSACAGICERAQRAAALPLNQIAPNGAKIVQAFEHHRRDEEEKYFPKLLSAAGDADLRELTPQWAAAKQRARLSELSGPLAGKQA